MQFDYLVVHLQKPHGIDHFTPVVLGGKLDLPKTIPFNEGAVAGTFLIPHEVVLEAAGKDGWELVQARLDLNSAYVFKRPMRP